jgi:integrase
MSKSRFKLFKRSNGTWYIVYDADGRTRWKSTGCALKSEAIRVLTNFEELTSRKIDETTLSKFKVEFLAFANSIYSAGTTAIYKFVLDRFEDLVGDVLLSKVTPRHADVYKTHRLKTIKPVTVNIELRSLRAAFNTALRWKLLVENPFKGIRLVPIDEAFPVYFSKTDFQKLLDIIKETWLRELVLFAAVTGMRQGEILNLCWEKVDMLRRLVLIEGTRNFRTKLGRKRFIPLNDIAIEVLKLRQRNSPSLYVFSLNGSQIKQDWVTHLFKKYVRKAGLNDRLHFHSLRHTFASWLVQKGATLYEVQKLLGHSDSKMTEVYSHLQPQQLNSAVNMISLE